MKLASSIRSLALLGALLLAGSSLAQSRPAEDPKTRLAKAEAMFQERCKKAGEFIHRTAENVEGILLMKVRPDKINYDDQYRMDDPYGSDVTGKGYFEIFLYGKDAKGSLVEQGARTNGYRHVDAIDAKDGKRYRYTGSVKAVGRKDITAYNVQIELKRDPNYDLNIYAFVLDQSPAPDPASRYGVTFDDISTREERDYWIAGSSLKVIDLKTNEVIAERIGYMMDRGQGNTGGGRAPWLMAEHHACPDFPKDSGGHPFKGYQTRNFVEKVLRIEQIKERN